jgi:hypothetical protein
VRKWIPAIPIVIGATVTAAVYRELPIAVRPPWHTVFPFVAGVDSSETMPRLVFALLIPGLAVIVWAALAAGAVARTSTTSWVTDSRMGSLRRPPPVGSIARPRAGA